VLDALAQENLVERPGCERVQAELETQLQCKLEVRRDQFRPGLDYIRQWGYTVDENGTAPFTE